MIYEVAHQMALLPWLALVWVRPKEPAIWWLAGVFLVAWLADWGGHWNPTLMSAVYPLSQAGLVAAVLLPRPRAWLLVGLLTAFALACALIGQPNLFRIAAWGSVTTILWFAPPLAGLRWPLLLYFGLGLVAWLAFVAGLPNSWLVYQAVRLVGLLGFSFAVLWPRPVLRVT